MLLHSSQKQYIEIKKAQGGYLNSSPTDKRLSNLTVRQLIILGRPLKPNNNGI